MSIDIKGFDSRAQASIQTAELLGAALQVQLEDHPTAILAVSGGSTPQACMQHLSQMPLPWHRVLVTLTDERCVPAQHPDSNERMLRQHLFTHHAAKAQFIPVQEVALQKQAPGQLTAVLLGMGADGHFASLFPDATNLQEGLDLDNSQATINVSTAASPHPRTSMTLARLMNSNHLLLLAFGNDKRTILETPTGYPVGQLLHTKPRHPSMQILWAE